MRIGNAPQNGFRTMTARSTCATLSTPIVSGTAVEGSPAAPRTTASASPRGRSRDVLNKGAAGHLVVTGAERPEIFSGAGGGH